MLSSFCSLHRSQCPISLFATAFDVLYLVTLCSLTDILLNYSSHSTYQKHVSFTTLLQISCYTIFKVGQTAPISDRASVKSIKIMKSLRFEQSGRS